MQGSATCHRQGANARVHTLIKMIITSGTLWIQGPQHRIVSLHYVVTLVAVEALTCGDLHTGGEEVLGVTRSAAAPLTELLAVLDLRHVEGAIRKWSGNEGCAQSQCRAKTRIL